MSVWEAIKFVTSGLTLVAFVAAVASWLLKSRQDSLGQLIKLANKKDLPGILDTYLRGAKIETTGLSPEGKERVALETIYALSKRYRQNTLVISFIAMLVAAVAGLSILRGNELHPPKQTDLFRMIIGIVMLEENEDHHHFMTAKMSITNSGSNALLVNATRLGVLATSMANGSVITKWFELMTGKQLPSGAIVPLELVNTEVSQWEQGGVPVSTPPSLITHYFKFMVQVQVTDGKSGKTSLLDIDMPRPVSMNCLDHHACIAVFELNVPGRRASHETCTALPAQTGFELKCEVQEESEVAGPGGE
jgi:hypothetical protein